MFPNFSCVVLFFKQGDIELDQTDLLLNVSANTYLYPISFFTSSAQKRRVNPVKEWIQWKTERLQQQTNLLCCLWRAQGCPALLSLFRNVSNYDWRRKRPWKASSIKALSVAYAQIQIMFHTGTMPVWKTSLVLSSSFENICCNLWISY